MVGYGQHPPHARWPSGAHLAVQFVLNYEEGSERSVLHGDASSEYVLGEIAGAAPVVGARMPGIESIYEYGSRVGFWRLHELFTSRGVALTVFGVAQALERNPSAVSAMCEAGWEVASHGLRWIDHVHMSEAEERAQISEAVARHTAAVGERPLGWYTGRNSVNTARLVAEEGGFVYHADSYSDDLPYFETGKRGRGAGGDGATPMVVVPYTFDINDQKFASPNAFITGAQFYDYLVENFDALLAEGVAGTPRMMSIGLHCRIAGRPGRAAALARFVDYVLAHPNVWICRRIDIARHWLREHGPTASTAR